VRFLFLQILQKEQAKVQINTLKNYLENSLGSAFEWETQIIVAYNEKYISKEKFIDLETKIQQIQRMISGFLDGLNK